MILPALLILSLGVFHLCYAVYAASCLHWAAEQTARCAAMSQQNTGTTCGTTIATAQTYATGLYRGPKLSALTFTGTDDTTNGCRRMQGSGTYRIATGFVNVDVPISAKACFPVAPTPTWPVS